VQGGMYSGYPDAVSRRDRCRQTQTQPQTKARDSAATQAPGQEALNAIAAVKIALIETALIETALLGTAMVGSAQKVAPRLGAAKTARHRGFRFLTSRFARHGLSLRHSLRYLNSPGLSLGCVGILRGCVDALPKSEPDFPQDQRTA
jgi:hypothetical protein